MAQHLLFIIGDGFYNRVQLKEYKEKHKFEKIEYQLKKHKQHTYKTGLFFRREIHLWIFNKGNSEPIGIGTMIKKQDYKKVTPATLKVIVHQNITRDYFKSLEISKAFGGIGRRKTLMLFIAVAVIIIALKAAGVY